MHVFAALFDPADNGFDITDLIAVFGLVAAVVGGVAAVWRWVAEPRIAKQLADATKPIQPTSNGGVSLPDVARNTDLIVERQTDIIRDMRAMRDRLDDHIDSHNRRP